MQQNGEGERESERERHVNPTVVVLRVVRARIEIEKTRRDGRARAISRDDRFTTRDRGRTGRSYASYPRTALGPMVR